MPTLIKSLDFGEDLLPLVEDFDCTSGDSTRIWEQEINDWIRMDPIKGDGAIFSLRQKKKKKVQVWLYLTETDDLIGYGSLGETSWPDPTVTDWNEKLPRKAMSLIPAVGVDRFYQGKPEDAEKGERYADMILKDLGFQARQHASRSILSPIGLRLDARKGVHGSTDGSRIPCDDHGSGCVRRIG